MAKALIVFSTRANQTGKIAELIGEGMRLKGVDVTLTNANAFNKDTIDFDSLDAVVLGSATYHGEMIQTMKTILFALEKANLEGKVGGAFGAYGWSGEAPGRIYDTMVNIYKMNMVGATLKLKSAMGSGAQMAKDYGAQIADKILGASSS